MRKPEAQPQYPILTRLIQSVPGKRFGEYRFLPFFFVLGGLLEYTMIRWRVGETNFYDTYKRRQASVKLDQENEESPSESSP